VRPVVLNAQLSLPENSMVLTVLFIGNEIVRLAGILLKVIVWRKYPLN
jgi:hypothetical protein